MEDKNLLSIFIKNKNFNIPFSKMKKDGLVEIIDKNIDSNELENIGKEMYTMGYIVCGVDNDKNYIYINYNDASPHYKKLIAKANRHFMKNLEHFIEKGEIWDSHG